MAIAWTVSLALLLALGVVPLAEAQSASRCLSPPTWCGAGGKRSGLRPQQPVHEKGRGRLAHPRTGRDRQASSTTRASRASSSNCPTDRNSRPVWRPPAEGAPTDYLWSTSWSIPEDYPTGSFNYKVVATALDGTTQSWEPLNVKPSLLTVVAGTFEPAK